MNEWCLDGLLNSVGCWCRFVFSVRRSVAVRLRSVAVRIAVGFAVRSRSGRCSSGFSQSPAEQDRHTLARLSSSSETHSSSSCRLYGQNRTKRTEGRAAAMIHISSELLTKNQWLYIVGENNRIR